MKKFITLGLTCLVMANYNISFAQETNFSQEANEVIKKSLQKKFLTSSIKVYVNSEKNNNSYARNKMTYMEQIGNKCNVYLYYDKNGIQLEEMNKQIQEISNFSNKEEQKLFRIFVILHESSHCEFLNMNNVFLLPNKELEKKVNYYFKYMQDSQQMSSLYTLLNENFADTYAAIQLIKIYGNNNSTLNVLNNFTTIRETLKFSAFEQQDKIDSHFTDGSLENILKSENLKQIEITTSPEQLKELALTIANEQINKIISSNLDRTKTLFKEDVVAKSLLGAFFYQIKANNLYCTEDSFYQKTAFSMLQEQKKLNYKIDINNLTVPQINEIQDLTYNKLETLFNNSDIGTDFFNTSNYWLQWILTQTTKNQNIQINDNNINNIIQKHNARKKQLIK